VFLTGQEEVETLVRLIENEGTEYIFIFILFYKILNNIKNQRYQSSYTLQPLPIYAGLAIDQQRIVYFLFFF